MLSCPLIYPLIFGDYSHKDLEEEATATRQKKRAFIEVHAIILYRYNYVPCTHNYIDSQSSET